MGLNMLCCFLKISMTLIQKSGSKFSVGPYLVLMAAVVKNLPTKPTEPHQRIKHGLHSLN